MGDLNRAMISGVLTVGAFASAFLFPWPFTAALALAGAFVEPILPLAVGLLMDTLYYTAHAAMPLFTFCGAIVTALVFFVRSRLGTGIIGR